MQERIIPANQTVLPVVILLMSLLTSCAPVTSKQHQGVLPVADQATMPGALQKLMQQADAQYAATRYSQTLVTLERALRINPRQPEVWSRMAQTSLQIKEYSQAKEYAQRALHYLQPESALYRFNQQILHTVEAVQ